MLTLGYLFLYSILLAVAVYFVYQDAKREFQASLKAQAQRSARKIKEQNKVIAGLRTEIETLSHAVNQIPAAKNILAMSSVNVRENMENRHVRANQQVVAVDGVQKVI